MAILLLLAAACSDTDTDEDIGFDLADAMDYLDEVADLPDVAIDEGDICPIEEDSTPFPVVYTANEFIFFGTEDELADLQVEVNGLEVIELLWAPRGEGSTLGYYLIQGEVEGVLTTFGEDAVFRQHYFALNPIHRGHPVDSPDSNETNTYEPESAIANADTDLKVAVIDAEFQAGLPFTNHGAFIVSLLSRIGVTGETIGIPVVPGASDSLFFKESEILKAIAEVSDIGGFGALNMSLGTYGCEAYDPTALISALDLLNIPVAASAGNDGVSQPLYPAAADRVYGVGSLDSPDVRSCFSNYGDWVDYWVVGEEVVAEYQGTEATWSGTSFAAPQIAAQVGNLPNPETTPQDVGDDNGYDC